MVVVTPIPIKLVGVKNTDYFSVVRCYKNGEVVFDITMFLFGNAY